MTPEEAALCLRDDPTFAASSREDQETEAAYLLGDDDMLAVALAIELALEAPKPPSVTAGPGDEGCRLETPCAAPRLAGNGRCLDCGASRSLRPAQRLSLAEAIAPGPRKPRRPSELRRGVTHDPTATFCGRLKEATGATDQELADIVGVSRASVQAYVAGRRTELLDDAATRRMIALLDEHLLLSATLKRDLAVAIGEAHHD
jgi:transcriptional regulator with XRE-family HTH domain